MSRPKAEAEMFPNQRTVTGSELFEWDDWCKKNNHFIAMMTCKANGVYLITLAQLPTKPTFQESMI